MRWAPETDRPGAIEMAVEFVLLGDVAVRVDGRVVDVGPARQRCVLVVLLIEVNRRVSADQLLDRVWGDQPPVNGPGAVYTYLSRLRRALAPTGVCLAREAGGYVLTADPVTVDLHRFAGLVRQANAADDEAARLALLDQSLGLWRGEAFAGLDSPWLTMTREALTSQRLAAELARNDLALRRGRHAELVTELRASAAADPLNERLASQLMLALHQEGRPADALDQFDRVRRRLAEDLGTEPGAALRQLHHQILTGDPGVATPATTGPVRPRQLPAPPRIFTGRDRELAELDKALAADGPVVISAIGGAGGIGKTCLALHWAHRHADRFADGQLYLNLHGFDPTGQSVQPAMAVLSLLTALGVDPAHAPRDLDALTGLYRSLLADRRMLVLLDNARDTEQVEPLLPGTPSCTVLVTSRRFLGGLVARHGARPVPLDILDPEAARLLLAGHVGADRLAAEPDAAATVLRMCAGLPLAISIVAARAATRPELPLAALAEDLRRNRLDALTAGEPSADLRTVLAASYRALPRPVADLFGLLASAPGPDIGLPAAVSLAGTTATTVRGLLGDLETAHLIHQPRPGRYRMHDLVRVFATEQARRDQPPEGLDTALRRLIDHYLHTAHASVSLLKPSAQPITLDPPAPGSAPLRFDDHRQAQVWFDTEHQGLLAAMHTAIGRGWHTAVWPLAGTLNGFHRQRGYLLDDLTICQAGLAATRHLDDPASTALAFALLGRAYTWTGRYTEALNHLDRALTMARRSGGMDAETLAHYALAQVWGLRDDAELALTHAEHALRLAQIAGEPVREADGLNATGWYHARVGNYDQARAYCQQALIVCRQHGYRLGEPFTLDSLGYVAHRTGQLTQALDYYHQCLALQRDLGLAYHEPDTLNQLGEIYRDVGRHDQARDHWRQAKALYRIQLRDTDAARVQHHLDHLHP